MRSAVALLALLGCNGDKPAPSRAPRRDAAPIAIDAAPTGPQFRLMACSPAPLPPSDTPKPVSARVTLGKSHNAAVDSVLAAHANRLQYCYEQNVGRAPDLHGHSRLSLRIKANGHVHEAAVREPFDPELSLCIKHIVSELTFPAIHKDTEATTTLDFAWDRAPTANVPLTSWIPYASGDILSPTEDAIVAAGALRAAMPTAHLASTCIQNQTGSLRAILRVSTAGKVTEVHAGGLGDAVAEGCIAHELATLAIAPPAHEVEVACDFVRGEPAPWRVSADDAVVLDPSSTARDIAAALATSGRAPATVLAMKMPSGAPVFIAASRHAGVVADPAKPLVLDAREPLRVCGGNLTESKSAPFEQAPDLFAAAAHTCTHKPCPTQLTITLQNRNADQLATLVAAARRAGFERIRLGAATCPK